MLKTTGGIILLALLIVVTACENSMLNDGEEINSQFRHKNKFTYTIPSQATADLFVKLLENNARKSGTAEQEDAKSILNSFSGILIPFHGAEEPYAQALATRSTAPTLLYTDAPWVQGYGRNNWIAKLSTRHNGQHKSQRGDYELEDYLENLPPKLKQAFSVPVDNGKGESGSALMAYPIALKGNLLFYRKDLLKKYCGTLEPPKTWEQMNRMGDKILTGMKLDGHEVDAMTKLVVSAKYLQNDCYPILWSYGAMIVNDHGKIILGQRKEALATAMVIIKKLIAKHSLLWGSPLDAFTSGKAIFMINWNTRVAMLNQWAPKRKQFKNSYVEISENIYPPIVDKGSNKSHVKKEAKPKSPHLIAIDWCAAPKGSTGDCYSNIGSYGWSVNRWAVDAMNEESGKRLIRKFLEYMTSEEMQYKSAVAHAEIPSRKDVVDKLRRTGEAREVVRLFDMMVDNKSVLKLKVRPDDARINSIINTMLRNYVTNDMVSPSLQDSTLKFYAHQEIQDTLKALHKNTMY